MQRSGVARWTPVAIAVGAFSLVVGGGVLLTRASDEGGSSPSTSTDPPFGDGNIGFVTTTVPAAPVPTAAPSDVPAVDNSVAAKVPLGRTLSNGLFGEDVKIVQQRLKDLSFDPGPVDGAYGNYTIQAVWAYQTLVMKLPRSEATGRVTPEMWDAMQGSVSVVPRRPESTSLHVEIYLPEQALVVFKDDLPILTAHISSGDLADPGDDFTKGATWCEEVTISPGQRGNEEGTEDIKDGRCGNATTPGGTYRFYRKVDGVRQSALGGMYNPVYFNYGIAIHGAQNVPNDPASHGCIRINNYLAEFFPDLVEHASGTEAKPKGDQVYVFNGVEEPETYGQKPGYFDTVWQEWRDENSTTTSTSSTSTTTPTTLPGQTTTAATAPPAATTAAPPPVTTTTTPPPTTTTTAAPPPPPADTVTPGP